MFLDTTLQKVLGLQKYDYFALVLNKSNKTQQDFQKEIAIIFSLFIIVITALFVLSYLSLIIYILLWLVSLPLIFIGVYSLELFKEEQRQKTIEKNIQDILLQASLFPKGTEITKIIDYIANQNYKYTSVEFKIALKQIKKGYSVQKSLQEICTRNKSKLLQRVIGLLIIGYKSGKDMHFVFNKISQYILHIHELERERYSSLAIQKYTLLISAAVLVPLILGWIKNIIAGFDVSTFQTLEIISQGPEMKEYAAIATYIYLAELSVISSFFVALVDGNKKKFIWYLLFILPCAFLVFFLV